MATKGYKYHPPKKKHNYQQYQTNYDYIALWGENCDTPKGLRLKELYADPNKKPIALQIAIALSVSLSEVRSAIVRFKLQKAPCFRDKPRAGKAPVVRQHVEPEPHIEVYDGTGPTLPTLPCLLLPMPSLQGVHSE
jgi:hypothetical protein